MHERRECPRLFAKRAQSCSKQNYHRSIVIYRNWLEEFRDTVALASKNLSVIFPEGDIENDDDGGGGGGGDDDFDAPLDDGGELGDVHADETTVTATIADWIVNSKPVQ
jgi:hypothetical protein